MPMSAMTLKSVLANAERQQRADARRGQRRDDRDRVDVALVEHAQDDVDRDDRREDEQRLAGERLVEGLRGPHEVARTLGGRPMRRLRRVDGRRRRRRATRPRRRLNEIVTAGNCPWWLMASGAVVVGPMHHRAERAPAPPVGRAHEDLVERGRGRSELGLHLEDDAVKVELREDDRDLSLAERVVERVVDQPAARCRAAKRCLDRSSARPASPDVS